MRCLPHLVILAVLAILDPALARLDHKPASHNLRSEQHHHHLLQPHPSLHPADDIAPLERDAATILSGGVVNTEGENHGPLWIPDGTTLRSIPVGTDGDMAPLFWPASFNATKITTAYVILHGRMRDGGWYWTIMNGALQSAVAANYSGVSLSKSLIISPQFFSTILNSGQYGENDLAYGDVNTWQAGEVATHPVGTRSSSFDVLDAIVDELQDKTKYPNMERLVLVGHGGGGQLMQRYAVVGKEPDLDTRYLVGDPSSCVYFTPQRPQTNITTESCPLYNTWRYGFDNFTGTLSGAKTPQDYFTDYVKRDVVYLIGLQDVSTSDGDQTCAAQMQASPLRTLRNQAYWKYINLLAGTQEDVSSFYGNFSNPSDPLPDWSSLSGGELAHRLVIVADADHSAQEVLSSDEGRSALFGKKKNIMRGWRPAGWKAPSKKASSGKKTTIANSTNTTSTSGALSMGPRGVAQSALLAALTLLPTLLASVALFA